MADESNAQDKSMPELTEAVLKEFQSLTDYAARKKYFQEHPELSRLYSPANFSA